MYIIFDVDETLYDMTQPFERAFQDMWQDKYDIDIYELYTVSRIHSDRVFDQVMAGTMTVDGAGIYRMQHAMADFGYEITEEEAERASRISRRCGTNYVVYVTAAGMTIGLLPLGHGLFQQLLTMGIAYEAFQMPTEKCPVVKSTLNLAGDALQRKIMTQEPHKGQLEAARKALNLLLAAEKGTLAEEEKQKYMENARERSWLDRLIG